MTASAMLHLADLPEWFSREWRTSALRGVGARVVTTWQAAPWRAGARLACGWALAFLAGKCVLDRPHSAWLWLLPVCVLWLGLSVAWRRGRVSRARRTDGWRILDWMLLIVALAIIAAGAAVAVSPRPPIFHERIISRRPVRFEVVFPGVPAEVAMRIEHSTASPTEEHGDIRLLTVLGKERTRLDRVLETLGDEAPDGSRAVDLRAVVEIVCDVSPYHIFHAGRAMLAGSSLTVAVGPDRLEGRIVGMEREGMEWVLVQLATDRSWAQSAYGIHEWNDAWDSTGRVTGRMHMVIPDDGDRLVLVLHLLCRRTPQGYVYEDARGAQRLVLGEAFQYWAVPDEFIGRLVGAMPLGALQRGARGAGAIRVGSIAPFLDVPGASETWRGSP